MPTKIDWKADVTVTGGPKSSVSRSIMVDAYDKLDATIPKKNGEKPGAAKLNVQPGASEKVKLLLITASVYGDGKKPSVSYTVEGGSEDEITLDQPQLLSGGLTTLLGKNPEIFNFKNPTDADVTVQILVGRDAKDEEPTGSPYPGSPSDDEG